MHETIHAGQQFVLRSAGLLALIGALLVGGEARAQKQQATTPGSPLLLVVSPSGGKIGTTFELTASGQDLDEAQGLLFSHAGIKAERISPPPGAAGESKTPEPKKGETKRRMDAKPGPVTAQHFKVTIPNDTLLLGIHDVRVINKLGVSNPRAFVVGDLAEVLEKEPNNDVAEAQRVSLNTTVNGAITTPTDVDYFVFSGKKDQRVVVSCLASSIDSRLQPGLELYDQTGKLLAFNKNYNGADALVDLTLPGDGDYYVRLYEFTYTQGSAEHFYRLSISTGPWIDAVFPPVVEPGKLTTLTVYGRNLPGGQLDPTAVVDGRVLEKATVALNAPNEPAALQRLTYRGHVAPNASAMDGFEYRIKNQLWSNPFLLTWARAPVVVDNEANDTPEQAQSITLPCEIAGRIEKKGDRDWYIFTAKKGDVYSIELYGDRLGSPIDLYFTLRDASTGKVLADLDDNPEMMDPIQFFTRTDDPPRYRFVVPADGRYQLLVASREAYVQAGPRDYYRVRITPEQPDFRLVLMPEAANIPEACIVQPGGRAYYTVYAWRLDGFNDEIQLTVEGLPPGVTCPAQVVGPGVQQATLVVSAEAGAKAWAGAIAVKGTATINGTSVVREARAATITWQAPQQNIAAISRLDRSLVMAVSEEKAPFTLVAGLDKAKVNPGDKITIPVKVVRQSPDFKFPIQISAVNTPSEGKRRGNRQQQQGTIVSPGKDETNVVVDLRGNVLPGNYTIVLRGEAQLSNNRNRQRVAPAIVQASAPIAVEISPRPKK
jgi:hypothetical protein